MIPMVFADGECGRILFVEQGRRIPYRVIHLNGISITPSFAAGLPKGCYITTREDVAGVDKFSFEHGAAEFTDECPSRTARGNKVLLL